MSISEKLNQGYTGNKLLKFLNLCLSLGMIIITCFLLVYKCVIFEDLITLVIRINRML